MEDRGGGERGGGDVMEKLGAFDPLEEDWETQLGLGDSARGFGICWDVNISQIYHREDFCDGRMSLTLMIATLVLGFVTVFVNLGVIIRTVKVIRQGHDKPAFYFIGNLALSDLAIGLFVVIAFLLHITQRNDLWQMSTCMLQIGVAVTVCQETIFTIMLISVDKYLYICHGLHYSTIVTRERVYVALALSWVLALLVGSLPAMGLHVSWEEACNRCAFAQVISTTFAVIFFVTTVAVPFAVVVSLYSILLVLALKMHKARYGGSYTAKESARSSNFRLSFMSKRSKSSRSTATSKCSLDASSSNSSKASRRRSRRKAMEEYKASHPGMNRKEATSTKLILYTKKTGEGVGSQFIQGTTSSGDKQNGASTPPESPQDAGAPLNIPCDALKERKESDSDARSCESSPPLPNGTKKCEEEEKEKKEEQQESIVKQGGDAAPTTRISLTEVNTTDTDIDFSTDNLPPLTSDDEAEATGEPTSEDGEERQRGWRSWNPSKYVNRVMTDTRDKVLFLKKCRAVKTIILITGSFTATYVPFVVGSLVYSAEQEKRPCLLHLLNTLLYCAVVANSLVNPLIYAYGYREFRLKTEKFKGVFAREKTRWYK